MGLKDCGMTDAKCKAVDDYVFKQCWISGIAIAKWSHVTQTGIAPWSRSHTGAILQFAIIL